MHVNSQVCNSVFNVPFTSQVCSSVINAHKLCMIELCSWLFELLWQEHEGRLHNSVWCWDRHI